MEKENKKSASGWGGKREWAGSKAEIARWGESPCCPDDRRGIRKGKDLFERIKK